MKLTSRLLINIVIGIGAAMIIIVTFRPGGLFALRVGQFSPLFGAFVGGGLVLACTGLSWRVKKDSDEHWTRSERISWLLIGSGVIAWGIGDSLWRYYVSLGDAPFPSPADVGYVIFPLLVFVGLLLQPQSNIQKKRSLLIMDSLIATGAILAIAWYLLLGSLAQATTEASLGKFLGLYYPASDIVLLSCIAIFLLRNQSDSQYSQARRSGLLLVGLGLCFFITSDFIFNIQQNAGTYTEATWIDLGWPLGMMTIGIGACVRRFPFALTQFMPGKRANRSVQLSGIPLAQYMPYILVGWLFLALLGNELSKDNNQQAIRPVLLIATLIVVSLVIARQIITMQENTQLLRKHMKDLEELTLTHQQVETQSRQITEQNMEMERGIDHLKDVQANLANGNLQARATLTHGVLWPLAANLNLMAERLARSGHDWQYSQRLRKALGDLSNTIQHGNSSLIPISCYEFPEINQLIAALQSQGANFTAPSGNRQNWVYPPQASTTPLPPQNIYPRFPRPPQK